MVRFVQPVLIDAQANGSAALTVEGWTTFKDRIEAQGPFTAKDMNIESLGVANLSTLKGGISLEGPEITSRPALLAVPSAGQIRAVSATNDTGFLRFSAGGGLDGSKQSYIDISGAHSGSELNGVITFGTLGSERLRLSGAGATFTGGATTFLTSSASLSPVTIKSTSSANTSASLLSLISDVPTGGLHMWLNSTTRSSDGPVNGATLRNDTGQLRLGVAYSAASNYLTITNTAATFDKAVTAMAGITTGSLTTPGNNTAINSTAGSTGHNSFVFNNDTGAAIAYYGVGNSAVASVYRNHYYVQAQNNIVLNPGGVFASKTFELSPTGLALTTGASFGGNVTATTGFYAGTIGYGVTGTAVEIGDTLVSARWRIQHGNSRLNFLKNNGSGTYEQKSSIAENGAFTGPVVASTLTASDVVTSTSTLDNAVQISGGMTVAKTLNVGQTSILGGVPPRTGETLMTVGNRFLFANENTGTAAGPTLTFAAGWPATIATLGGSLSLSGGDVLVKSTADSALQVSGGMTVVKSLTVGARAYVKGDGGGGTVRVAPIVAGSEASIAFFGPTDFSAVTAGDQWVLGRNSWGQVGGSFTIGSAPGLGACLTVSPSTGDTRIWSVTDSLTGTAAALRVDGGILSAKSLTLGNNTSLGFMNAAKTSRLTVLGLDGSNVVRLSSPGSQLYIAPDSSAPTDVHFNNAGNFTIYNGATKHVTVSSAGVQIHNNLSVSGAYQPTNAAGVIIGYDIYNNFKFGGGANTTNDWHLDASTGAQLFSIRNDGRVAVVSSADATAGTSSGAFQVLGGVGVAKGITAGGKGFFGCGAGGETFNTDNPIARVYDTAMVNIQAATHNGGTVPAAAEPVLNLLRSGVSGQSWANSATFFLSRYENSAVNSRTQLDISLAHGTLNLGDAAQTRVMRIRSDGTVHVPGSFSAATATVTGTLNANSYVIIGGGATNVGASGTGGLAFEFPGGGYRHYVRSRHDNAGLVATNQLEFFLNTSTTAAGSSAPGVGNALGLTITPLSLDVPARSTIGGKYLVQNATAGATFSTFMDQALTTTCALNVVSSANNRGTTADVDTPLLSLVKPGVNGQSNDSVGTFYVKRYNTATTALLEGYSELSLGLLHGNRVPGGDGNVVTWRWRSDGTVFALGTQPASSPQTGALRLSGGLGVLGSVYSGGSLNSTGSLTVGGFDFILGNADQTTSRGHTGASRALVKDDAGVLTINYAGDFTGGAKVDSTLVVNGNTTVNRTLAAGALGTGLHSIKTNSVGDVLSLQNTNTAGFSTMQFLDFTGAAKVFVGYGNSGSSIPNTGYILGGIGLSRMELSGSVYRVTDTTDSSILVTSTYSSAAGSFQVVGGGSFGKQLQIGGTVTARAGNTLGLTGGNASGKALVALPGTNPWGCAVSVDATSLTGGMDWWIFSTGGTAAEGRGHLIFRNNTNSSEVGIQPTGEVYIKSATASTSTVSGALRVSGGAGIAGALYAGSGTFSTAAVTSGVNNAVTISTTHSATWTTLLYMSAALTTGQNAQFMIGSTVGGTNNMAQIGFNYAGGNGSSLNFGYLGMGGSANALQWYPSGSVTFPSMLDNAVQLSGGMTVAKTLNVGTKAYIKGNGGGGTVQIAPLTTGAEAAIGFYGTTDFTSPSAGDAWVVGRNSWGQSGGAFVIGVQPGLGACLTIAPATGETKILSTSEATATSGALLVSGGLSVAKNMFANNVIVPSGTSSGYFFGTTLSNGMAMSSASGAYFTNVTAANDLTIRNTIGNIRMGVSSGSSSLDILATTGAVAVNTSLLLPSANLIEFGFGVAGKEANAGKMGYGIFDTTALSIVGAGATSGARRVRIFDILETTSIVVGSINGGPVTSGYLSTGALLVTNAATTAASPAFKVDLTGSNLSVYRSGATDTVLRNSGSGIMIIENNLRVNGTVSINGNNAATETWANQQLATKQNTVDWVNLPGLRSGAVHVSYAAPYEQGAYLAWNRSPGTGATYIMNQPGTGGGGIVFENYSTTNALASSMTFSHAGQLTVPSIVVNAYEFYLGMGNQTERGYSIGRALVKMPGTLPASELWVNYGNDFTGGTRIDSVLKVSGDVSLISATPKILMGSNASGLGKPTKGTRSAGSRVVLWESLSSTLVDYALGMEGSVLWSSVPSASEIFRWYGGDSEAMALHGDGRLYMRNAGSRIEFNSGGGNGFTWNVAPNGPVSRVFDDGHLRLWTDDQMYFDVGGTGNWSGGTTNATNALLLTSTSAKFNVGLTVPSLNIGTKTLAQYITDNAGTSFTAGAGLNLTNNVLTVSLGTFAGRGFFGYGGGGEVYTTAGNGGTPTLSLQASTHNGGTSLAAAEPVLNLVRSGVGGQSWANLATFYISRYEAPADLGPRTQLDLTLSHGPLNQGAGAHTTVARFRSDGTVAVPNAVNVGTIGYGVTSTSIEIGDAVVSARWRLQHGYSRLNFLKNNGSGTYEQKSSIAENGAFTGPVEASSLTASGATTLAGLTNNGVLTNNGDTVCGNYLYVRGGAGTGGEDQYGGIAFDYQSGGYRHFIRSRHHGGQVPGNAIDFYIANQPAAGQWGSSAPEVNNTRQFCIDASAVVVPYVPLRIDQGGIQVNGGNINMATHQVLRWGNDHSKIYDNGDLRVYTDNTMHFDTGGRTDAMTIAQNGTVTATALTLGTGAKPVTANTSTFTTVYPPDVCLITSSTFISSNEYAPGVYVFTDSANTADSWRAFRPSGQSSSPWTWDTAYNSSTGAYTGAAVTTASGTAYRGGWVQMTCPQAVSFNQVKWTGISSGTTVTMVVAGSNNGTTWVAFYNGNAGTVTLSPYEGPYKYWRLIITNHTSGANANGLAYYGATVTTMSEPASQGTISSNTHVSNAYYGSGTYVFSASSPGTTDAWRGFTSGTGWYNSTVYYTAANQYTGTQQTGGQNNGFTAMPLGGEWVQVKLPNARTLATYSVGASNVNQLQVYGSPDGTAWHNLTSGLTGTINAWRGKFLYYRFVVTYGSGAGPVALRDITMFFVGPPPSQGYDTELNVNASGFVIGNLTVAGALSKASGSFVIKHPDPAKRHQGMVLRHCFVESPTRGDNLYRFTIQTREGRGVIPLPDYFPHLNEDVQIWVNARRSFARAYAEIDWKSNAIWVTADQDATYDILVVGTRKDEDAKEHFDRLGVEYST